MRFMKSNLMNQQLDSAQRRQHLEMAKGLLISLCKEQYNTAFANILSNILDNIRYDDATRNIICGINLEDSYAYLKKYDNYTSTQDIGIRFCAIKEFKNLAWVTNWLLDKLKNTHELETFAMLNAVREVCQTAADPALRYSAALKLIRSKRPEYIRSGMAELTTLALRANSPKIRLDASVSMLHLEKQRRMFNRNERIAILERANFKCVECFIDLTLETMHADHIHPYSRGGLTDIENGQALCAGCNMRKGNKI